MTDDRLIAFRVDAGIATGLGHLSRCLTLADALRVRGSRILFLISPESRRWSELIARRGFDFHVLAVEDKSRVGIADAHAGYLRWGQDADAEACRRLLPETAAWLVVDHYGLDKTWETSIRSQAARLLVIDDLADREHCCDVLLDQNVKPPTSYMHLVPRDCLTLIGPRHALLRAEFAKARGPKRARRAARINVFMGGTDNVGATVRVLDDVAQDVRWEKLDVIMGGRSPHLGAVRQRVERWPDAELHVDCNNAAELFAAADIAVGAGGVAALERCCVGLPSVAICVADNQVAGLSALAELGVVESLGWLSDLRRGRIGSAVGALMADSARRQEMSAHAMVLVDGQGADRVADLMLAA